MATGETVVYGDESVNEKVYGMKSLILSKKFFLRMIFLGMLDEQSEETYTGATNENVVQKFMEWLNLKTKYLNTNKIYKVLRGKTRLINEGL